MTHPTPSPAADDGRGVSDGRSDGRGQKRPPWDDESSANDRSSKRRASRACLSCRNRKVRCDVVKGGVPCTNCRLDRIDCVVTESNRGRRPTVAASAAAHITTDPGRAGSTDYPAANANSSTTSTAPVAHAAPAAPPISPHCHCSHAHNHRPPSRYQEPRGPHTAILSPPHTGAEDYLVSLSFEGW
ncbi:hypothetical protein NW767_013997 [Fusarium falciforme]|nr:hypothetical protein NW767_013997 [Fusarium falciforme]